MNNLKVKKNTCNILIGSPESFIRLINSQFIVTGSTIDKAVSSSIPRIQENNSQWLKLHDKILSGCSGL